MKTSALAIVVASIAWQTEAVRSASANSRFPLAAHAETLYVDPNRGRDANAGSTEHPLQTLREVAARVNAKTTREATTVTATCGREALWELHSAGPLSNAHEYVSGARFYRLRRLAPN